MEEEENKSELELLKLKKEIWEKAVDTQQHFNEMSVKSRQLGLSFVVGALGLSVVLLGRTDGAVIHIPIVNFILSINSAALVLFIAAAGLYGVRRLDLGVYHQMLRGSVKFGEELEDSGLRQKIMGTPLGMTEFISLYSRHATVTKTNGKYHGQTKRLAESKIAQFYTYTILALISLGIIVGYVYGEIKPATSLAVSPTNVNVSRQVTSPKVTAMPAAAAPSAPSEATSTENSQAK